MPQTPSDLLYLDTVAGECAQADAESGAEPGAARALLDRLAPGIDDASHPRDLSEGQQLALVLAIQFVAAPQVVLLDEPTRGLDYAAKAELSTILDGLAADGRTVVVATHDVEFVAHASPIGSWSWPRARSWPTARRPRWSWRRRRSRPRSPRSSTRCRT